MTDTQCRQFMKNFFERYYKKLEQIENGIALMYPLEDSDRVMWSEDANPQEEWKKWKLVPSTITEEDMEQLEKAIGVKLPQCLRALMTVYHHCFHYPVGCNLVSNPFEDFLGVWNPLLVEYGYLPFAWDEEGYYIRCIHLKNMPDEEQCGIYRIDHELLFSIEDGAVQQGELDKNMEYISQNLFTYLETAFHEVEQL